MADQFKMAMECAMSSNFSALLAAPKYDFDLKKARNEKNIQNLWIRLTHFDIPLLDLYAIIQFGTTQTSIEYEFIRRRKIEQWSYNIITILFNHRVLF
jgi:hypothetical protein